MFRLVNANYSIFFCYIQVRIEVHKVKEKRKNGVARLLELSGQKKYLLILGCLLGAVATVLQFIPAILSYLAMMSVMNSISTATGIEVIYVKKLAWVAFTCFLTYGLLFYVASMCTHIAAFDILYSLRLNLARKLSRLGMGYFQNTSSGKIKQVMSDDVENIEKFIAHHLVDMVSAFAVLLISAVSMIMVDWRLAIAAFLPTVLGIISYIKSYSTEGNKQLTEQYYREITEISGTTVEYVNGMPVLKIFGGTGRSLKRLEEQIVRHERALKSWSRSFAKPIAGFSTAIASPLAFILPIGILLSLLEPDLTTFLPRFFFFLLVGVSMNLPLSKLLFLVSMMSKITEGIRHIDNLLYIEEMEEPGNPKTPAHNGICFEHVSFAYEEKDVLHDISFTIKPGETVGIVGPSGGGKSTIAQLIARFFDVNQGSIQIGDVDIRNITIHELMESISFVFQEVYMFCDTIENNIRMGRDVTYEEVVNAAKAAQADEFIRKLPKGYETVLGEEGIVLSGGEQQRLSIARAILKNAPIVILDEATAYADAENESKIQDAFVELTQNKTVLVIAHRLSTITGADKIFVLDEGYLREVGTHKELLEQKGLYAHLYEAYTGAQNWNLKGSMGEKI